MHSEREVLSTNTTIQQEKPLPVIGQGRTTRTSARSSVVIFGCVPKTASLKMKVASFESGGMQIKGD